MTLPWAIWRGVATEAVLLAWAVGQQGCRTEWAPSVVRQLVKQPTEPLLKG